MKRFLVMAVLVIVTAGVVGTGAGAADGLVDEQSGFACGVIDADGIFRVTTDSYYAEYSSGRLYLRCVAHDGSNSSGAIHTTNFSKTGFTCSLGGVVTTTWHTRHARNGTAQLECFGWANQRDAAAVASASSAGQ